MAPAAMDIKFRDDDSTDEDSDDSAAEPHIVMDLACGVFDLQVPARCKDARCMRQYRPTNSVMLS